MKYALMAGVSAALVALAPLGAERMRIAKNQRDDAVAEFTRVPGISPER